MVTLHSHATRLGVLDIGSNTVHMLIVDAAPGARPEPEASTKSTIRLMQYLKDDGSIKKAGIEALLSAVEKAMKLAEEYEITQLLVLATSALREAPNGGKILRKIEEAIGQPVTVLSGVDEARLTFLAARRWYGWDAGRLLVIDIGGGSLEVAMGSDEDPTVALSVPAGAGRVTREFLPESGVADDDDLEAARKNIRKILE
ncbi:Ppx/GppA family phosphatase, partial [Bifidobacterium adolescentis]